MQDIDFDEIDRAVSSVSKPGSEPVAPVVSTPTPAVSAPAPIIEDRALAAALAGPEVASPATRRSSGRFMDVVHSSSDMRPARPDSPAISPRETVSREVVAERPELVSEPVVQKSAAFQWPDPIELHESTQAPVVEIPAPIELPVVPEPIEVAATPLESPFLADAKVEKRPLGAFSGPDSELPLLEDFPAPAVNTEPIVEELEIPAELGDDILSLETPHVDELPEITPPVAVAASVAPVVTGVPVGPTSITQQYKEQTSSVSEPSGSIFDTEAYHQPLTHPVKKHSAALVIVWLSALIIVGGGIGAAIYFFVIPLLG